MRRPQAPAKFQNVIAVNQRGIVLHLIAILTVVLGPGSAAASDKVSEYVDDRVRIDGILQAVVANELEAGFVYDL